MRHTNKVARSRCSSSRAELSTPADNQIVQQQAWTRIQCRAIEISLGGGFLLLAILEAMFRW